MSVTFGENEARWTKYALQNILEDIDPDCVAASYVRSALYQLQAGGS